MISNGNVTYFSRNGDEYIRYTLTDVFLDIKRERSVMSNGGGYVSQDAAILYVHPIDKIQFTPANGDFFTKGDVGDEQMDFESIKAKYLNTYKVTRHVKNDYGSDTLHHYEFAGN